MIEAVRSSHCTSSNGSTPGRVKYRVIESPRVAGSDCAAAPLAGFLVAPTRFRFESELALVLVTGLPAKVLLVCAFITAVAADFSFIIAIPRKSTLTLQVAPGMAEGLSRQGSPQVNRPEQGSPSAPRQLCCLKNECYGRLALRVQSTHTPSHQAKGCLAWWKAQWQRLLTSQFLPVDHAPR